MEVSASSDKYNYFNVNENSPLLGNEHDNDIDNIQNEINDDNDRFIDTSGIQVAEDQHAYKSRWKSIRIAYFAQFLLTLTYSITISSLWPFLQVLEPSASTSFLGWVVAAFSLGQLIASPLFGAWSNIRKSTKEPLTISVALCVIANVFYMYLQSLPSGKHYFLVVCRGFIGASAGSTAVLRSYISSATTTKERTSSMANYSVCQVVGFIMGPVIQAALVPISYPGPVEKPALHFNMYTAPALLSAVALFVNLILLLTVFTEHNIPDEGLANNTNIQSDHAQVESADCEKPVDDDYKPDYVAMFSMLLLFFVTMFMFTMYETISTPVTMHMYAWSKSQAAFYQGFLFAGGGFVAFFVFVAITPLSKRFSDRQLLLAGFVLCVGGIFLFISWGDTFPPRPLKRIQNSSYPIPTTLSPNESSKLTTDGLIEISDSFASSDVHNSNIRPKSDPNVKSLQDTLHSPHTQAFYRSQNSSPLNQVDRNKTDVILKADGIESDDNFGLESSSSNRQNVLLLQGRTSFMSTSTFQRLVYGETTTSVTHQSRVTAPSTITKPDVHSANSIVESKGCPWSYDWCSYTPYLPLAQYISAVTLTSIGYPLCQVFSFVLFSKVLGSKPQGLWMGWLGSVGSLARTLGPVYVSYTYTSFGPRVAYGSVTGLMFITALFTLLVYRRLVPFSSRAQKTNYNAI